VTSIVQIAVGVLRDADGRVLISERPLNTHLGGFWEFPGGKVEVNESVETALTRELDEELGVRPLDARPLIQVRHSYAEKEVLLDVFLVRSWQGNPHGREDQAICWRFPWELDPKHFPAADAPIISALCLPSIYFVTPDPDLSTGSSRERFFSQIEAVLSAGVELCQLRAPQLERGEYRKVAIQAAALCAKYASKLLVNAAPAEALAVGANGVHLSTPRLLQLNQRPLSKDFLVSASCHSRGHIEHANRLGLDFITVSPVKVIETDSALEPLGWGGFKRLAERSTLPVYALGGLDVNQLDNAWQAGAQGLAMFRGLWMTAPSQWARSLPAQQSTLLH
jgi:8-oxo-dGTP diphosphatase